MVSFLTLILPWFYVSVISWDFSLDNQKKFRNWNKLHTQTIQIPQLQKILHPSFSCFEIRLKIFLAKHNATFLTGYLVPNKLLFMFCFSIWKFRWKYFEVWRYIVWSIFYPGISNSTSKRLWLQNVTCHTVGQSNQECKETLASNV